MTGKSKWSDEIQKYIVKQVLVGKADWKVHWKIFMKNYPVPSQKTFDRWTVKWKPIIEEEIHQDKIRQEQTRKGQHKPKKPKLRHDNFKGAYAAWLGLYPSMKKRFIRFGYGNFLDFTEVVNDYFEKKKEVDK